MGISVTAGNDFMKTRWCTQAFENTQCKITQAIHTSEFDRVKMDLDEQKTPACRQSIKMCSLDSWNWKLILFNEFKTLYCSPYYACTFKMIN